jgi:hypothetical protein
VCQPASAISDCSGAARAVNHRESVSCLTVLQGRRVPGFTISCSRSPPASSRPPGRPAFAGRSRLPRGSCPLTAFSGPAAVMRWARPSPPRRRSRVFSTPQRFWHTRRSRPCLMPQPSLGFLPFEALLLVGVAAASRLRSAPLRLDHRASKHDRLARGLSLRVSPTPMPLARHGGRLPTGAASAVSSVRCCHRTGSPTLRTACATTGSRRHRLRPLRSFAPPTKPYRAAGEAAHAADAPLGFRPSRALLRSTLGPSHPADRSVHPRPSSSARRRGERSLAVR